MIYYIIIIVSIIFAFFVANLVINNKLLPKYSVLWIGYSIVLIIMSFSIKYIDIVAKILGVYYAPSVIFIFAILFFMFYTLHLSIVATKENYRTIKLTQELSILKERVKILEKSIEK